MSGSVQVFDTGNDEALYALDWHRGLNGGIDRERPLSTEAV